MLIFFACIVAILWLLVMGVAKMANLWNPSDETKMAFVVYFTVVLGLSGAAFPRSPTQIPPHCPTCSCGKQKNGGQHVKDKLV